MFKERYEWKLNLHGPDHSGTKRLNVRWKRSRPSRRKGPTAMSTEYDYYGRNIRAACSRCAELFRLPQLNCNGGRRMCSPCLSMYERQLAADQERADRADAMLLHWHAGGPPWTGRPLRGLWEAMLRGKFEAWRARMRTYRPLPAGFCVGGCGDSCYCLVIQRDQQ
jgi:hypothetical protein